MEQQEQQNIVDLPIAGTNAAVMSESLATGGVAADAASDAAVGGSVGPGGCSKGSRGSKGSKESKGSKNSSGKRRQKGSASKAASNNGPLAAAGVQFNVDEHSRRHVRKRALSNITSATAGSNGSTHLSFGGGLPLGSYAHSNGGAHVGPGAAGASPAGEISQVDGRLNGDMLMNMPIVPTGTSTGSNSGSIVSFGLNFNFDSTSSPSNSDSGDMGDRGEGVDGAPTNEAASNRRNQSGQQQHHLMNNNTKKSVKKGNGVKSTAAGETSGPPISNGRSGVGVSNVGGNSGGSNNSGSKSNKNKKSSGAGKFGNNVSGGGRGTGEEGSSSSSDSSNNCDSGGSASGGSNSGNDGSSGGKSTISSLTTSSNQEWITTNEAVGTGVSNVCAGGEATARAEVADGKKEAGHKRKAFSKSEKVVDGTGVGEDEDSTGGYNTDEEQWGGAPGKKKGGGQSVVHKQHHHANEIGGANKANLATPFNKNSASNGLGPPLKQARFSTDLHPGLQNVPSGMGSIPTVNASGSGQLALSSLSSDTAQPAVTATIARSPHPSTTSATAAATSSNKASTSNATSSDALNKPTKKKPVSKHPATMDPRKREERNAREKERSCRIARQIDDLRSLLLRGGVVVAKGTKSAVLSEAANYINMLQEQQCQWELDRQSLIQQVQQAGSGPDMAVSQPQHAQSSMAISPNAGMSIQPLMPGSMAVGPTVPQGSIMDPSIQQQQIGMNGVCPNDYKYVFNNSSVGMAIASMGGAFVDCNDIFCELSGYSREEVCSMTIFNMTSRSDLQHAFELISQMITPTLENANQEKSNSVVLRGAMKKRDDLGLSISLIKGELGIAKCFCITLVKILSVEACRPDTVAIEMELPQVGQIDKTQSVGFGGSPAYTLG